ncbi:helix-turn-helix transcriptional regulator [Haloechinothrix salitolerans]|uniref:Helix-turn-helix domain-containing protein n=1 Tax=Haloechinothrix salitolerans TaxID=926830 RepID=A0ABW2C4X4_9PSEU
MHLDSEHYQRLLGNELRALRKSRGWTRKQLNARLQSTISLQTLATYEHGTRHCSVVRFAEICLALGEKPHDVLARVDRRLFTTAADEIRVDLTRITESTDPTLLPLRRWAADRLREADPATGGEITLTTAAVERMAELCGTTSVELLGYLRDMTGRLPTSS